MAIKPMVRLDRVQNGHIESFRYATELNQGTVVSLGALNADDTYVGGVVDLLKQTVFHCSVPMNYDESIGEDEFVVKANVPARGYILTVGDIVTITNDGVSGTPAVGKVLGLEATKNVMKIYADLATSAASGLAFNCERTDVTLGGYPASVYKVIRV